MFTLLITVCVMNGASCDEFAIDTDLTIQECSQQAIIYQKQERIEDIICQLQPKRFVESKK